MAKWEYMVDRPFGKICTHLPKESREKGETGDGNIEKYFNKLGDQGWEFCGIDEYKVYYFKRKISVLHKLRSTIKRWRD